MEESFEDEVRRLMQIVGLAVARWNERLGGPNPDRAEFALRLAPVTGPGTSPFDVVNAFREILGGTRSPVPFSGGRIDVRNVHILEIVTEEPPSVSAHSYLVTPLPLDLYRGNLSVPSHHSYAFVRAATSGYSGVGPEIHRVLSEMVKKSGQVVQHETSQGEWESLVRLFVDFGPTLSFRWPSFRFPPGDEWERRS